MDKSGSNLYRVGLLFVEQIDCDLIPNATHPFAEMQAGVFNLGKSLSSKIMHPSTIWHANAYDISITPRAGVAVSALSFLGC
jgi:hypothetical protein